MKATFVSIVVLLLVAAPILAPAPVEADHAPIPFTTISQGAISFYRYADANFLGADFAIKDEVTWKNFWERHTSGITPPPPLPKVDFTQEMVIATLLGFQTTGGGPQIQVVQIDTPHECNCLHVLIEDDETPGPLDVITNPFHIVKLRRVDVPSIVFEHQKPPARS